MRTLIVYYSLSGTTRNVVTALAELLGAELVEVRCDRYRRGIVGYLRAGHDSIKSRLPDIEVPPAVDQACDLMIVAAPIWAGHAATPIRAFLARGRKLPDKVGLLLTSGGSSADRAFAEMQAQFSGPAKARLGLTAKQIKDRKLDDTLRAFAADLAGSSFETSAAGDAPKVR